MAKERSGFMVPNEEFSINSELYPIEYDGVTFSCTWKWNPFVRWDEAGNQLLSSENPSDRWAARR